MLYKLHRVPRLSRQLLFISYTRSEIKKLNFATSRQSSVPVDYEYIQRSKVPTLHFQKSLPRLPIPELEKTCDRYLKALQPITASDKFSATRLIVENFRNGIGKDLHAELKSIDERNKHTSYISGPWFDRFLKSRAPLPLNNNPFVTVRDDPQKQYNQQLLKATNLLISSVRFMKSLQQGLLEPSVYFMNGAKSNTPFFQNVMRWIPDAFSCHGAYLFKASPLNMSHYGNVFNSTRIPHLGKDLIQVFPEGKHVLVMRKGRFYTFDILDSDGNIIPPSHVFSQLDHILKDTSTVPSHPISILTTEERDTWARAREHLERLGNGEVLRLIDSALFVLALDDEEIVNDDVKMSHHMLHGPIHNRWFDKSFQLIITKDGTAGINWEHSWGDGAVAARSVIEIVKDSTENHFVGPDTIPANIDASQLVRKLDFKLDAAIKSAVCSATEKHRNIIKDFQMNVLMYSRLNRDVIKKFKLRKDSVMQLGFQMAYFKMYSNFVASNEPCSTAMFKHGRTEWVRQLTAETKRFVEEVHMQHKPSPAALRGLLHQCSSVHGQLTKEAAMGQGFDRHLYGLRCIAEKRGELPELYKDPAFVDANHFRIFTSTISGSSFTKIGCGPVVNDGFGIVYIFLEDRISFSVSSYTPFRDGAGFIDALEKSYDDIHEILLKSSTS